MTPPRYDEVYEQGTALLDAMARGKEPIVKTNYVVRRWTKDLWAVGDCAVPFIVEGFFPSEPLAQEYADLRNNTTVLR